MNFDYAREVELTGLINCLCILQFESGATPKGSKSRVDLEEKS